MRNYTKAERAFIIMGILAGVSREELNDKLLEDQRKTGQTIRIINENSLRCYTLGTYPLSKMT